MNIGIGVIPATPFASVPRTLIAATDFTEYTSGQAPSDWTEQHHIGSNEATVENTNLPAGASASALKIVGSGANDRYFVSWDAIGTPSDPVEVLVKARHEAVSAANSLWVGLRGSGTSTSENVYFVSANSNNNEWLLRKFVNASATTLDTAAVDSSANVWHWVRFQADGTTIRARIWADGDPEPGPWSLQATDADLTSGWVGIGGFTQITVWVDQISVKNV